MHRHPRRTPPQRRQMHVMAATWPAPPRSSRMMASRTIGRCCWHLRHHRRARAGKQAVLARRARQALLARKLPACRRPTPCAHWSPGAHQRAAAPRDHRRSARHDAARWRTQRRSAWAVAHGVAEAAAPSLSSAGSRRALPAALPPLAGQISTR